MTTQSPQITPEETQEKFQEKMAELQLKAKEQEVVQQAARSGIPYINLKGFPISAEALALIPEHVAREKQVVCFFHVGEQFRVGTVAPNQPAIQELIYQIGERVHGSGVIYLISPESLRLVLPQYGKLPKIRPPLKGVAITEEALTAFGQEFRSFDELQARLKGVSVSDLVTLLIAAALKAEASDLHVEAEEAAIVVRFRLDGILHPVAKLPKEDWPKIISRLKLLSGLKINVTDRPQDGRFTIFTKVGNIDVRVSTLPTAYGESVVARLLRSTAVGLKFEDLGIRGVAYEQLRREVERPNGMIITTGPTGSGKTTTLYAILNKLNAPETKIITLEDPVEYKLPGIAQSQIDVAKEYTFASGLRSILRQDPDVIMVGEIRDLETADIAIQAALTGHLVLSTIHTNSAAGAIPRFLALGAKSFLLAPALNAIVAQRLVRKIHEECKEEVRLDEVTMKRMKEIFKGSSLLNKGLPLDAAKFYRGRGCGACFDLGYKGRVGIYEVMTMNKEIEEALLSGKMSEYLMREIAVKNGMVTMVQDGLLKALDGITTVEEVFSVAE